MQIKRLLRWLLGVAVLLGVVAAGGLTYHFYTAPPLRLLVWMDPGASPAWLRWVSRQALFAFHPTENEARALNAEAGARYAAMFPDRREAERILRLFLARGVDINSAERLSGMGLTALHAVAMNADPEPVRLLLAYGADPTVTDEHGRTALDLALAAQGNRPEADYAGVIRLLEAALRRQPERTTTDPPRAAD